MYDVAIIGCGIVGAAAAYELSRYRLSAVVLEAENDVSTRTTKANSAIIHAGYDPEPQTLMARLNIRGNELTRDICERLDVPYKQCGSLVLAFSRDERETLEKLYRRGVENGVPGICIWSREELLEREPNISEHALAALYAPTAAICSPWELALALVETAARNGVEIRLNSRVRAISRIEGGYRVEAGEGLIEARYIINAAGTHADKVHDMVASPEFRIIPDRGVYYLLDKSEGTRVRRVIFQCPTKLGKGTLVSPTVHGNLIVGPNNEAPGGEDDVSVTAKGLAEIQELAKKSVPGVNIRESIRNFAGIRAAADKDDFIIQEAKGAPGFIDLAGIKSPGLTSAPAIAELAAELLGKSGLVLEAKDNFIDTRKRVRFSELSQQEKADVIAKNPAYGRVICRCETVTEGEIIDAINSPIPPCSVDGVKRRVNAGMGRCQGGFCGPRVVEILARELKISPLEVVQDRAGTTILTGETKGDGKNA